MHSQLKFCADRETGPRIVLLQRFGRFLSGDLGVLDCNLTYRSATGN